MNEKCTWPLVLSGNKSHWKLRTVGHQCRELVMLVIEKRSLMRQRTQKSAKARRGCQLWAGCREHGESTRPEGETLLLPKMPSEAQREVPSPSLPLSTPSYLLAMFLSQGLSPVGSQLTLEPRKRSPQGVGFPAKQSRWGWGTALRTNRSRASTSGKEAHYCLQDRHWCAHSEEWGSIRSKIRRGRIKS